MNNVFVSVSSLVGRVLVALLFLLSGPGKIAQAAATAGFMASVGLPNSPTLAVLVGLFEMVAGLALATGAFTRWAAVALAVFTAAASLIFHAYWALPPDQQFIQQLLFSKNVAVVGGLLVIAGFGPGVWSWDERRAARESRLDRRLA